MSDLELHKYLSLVPDAALQEFTEWCVLEQAKAAGFKLMIKIDSELEYKAKRNEKCRSLRFREFLKNIARAF